MTINIDQIFLRRNPLPLPEKEGSKQHRGRVLIIAGSVEMPGAALLAANGALRAGAGILQLATSSPVAIQIGVAMPEALVIGCDATEGGGLAISAIDRLGALAQQSDAVLIGPGMIDDEAVHVLTHRLLQIAPHVSFVLDASAISTPGLSIIEREGAVILTPHAGEMASLLQCDRDAVERDPLEAAQRAVDRTGVFVVMKGAETFIAARDGRSWVSAEGTIGLATSGSGDVLAGILAGLLARGTDPALAAAWAVYLHAMAGRRLTEKHGNFGLLAREIAAEVPCLMNEIPMSW